MESHGLAHKKFAFPACRSPDHPLTGSPDIFGNLTKVQHPKDMTSPSDMTI